MIKMGSADTHQIVFDEKKKRKGKGKTNQQIEIIWGLRMEVECILLGAPFRCMFQTTWCFLSNLFTIPMLFSSSVAPILCSMHARMMINRIISTIAPFDSDFLGGIISPC